MKRLLGVLLSITAVLCLILCVASCGEISNVQASNDEYFEQVDISLRYRVWYDKSTKVMYVQAGESDTFTLLVDADGDPLLYKGD